MGKALFPSIPNVPDVPKSMTFTLTLAAGSSTATFTNAFIGNTGQDKRYDVYTDKDDLLYDDIYVTGYNCVVTFAPQITDTVVKLIVTNI